MRVEDRIAIVRDTAGAAVKLHQGTVVGHNGLLPVVDVAGTPLEMVDIATHDVGDIVQVISAGGRWIVLGTVTPGSGPNLVPSLEHGEGWNWDIPGTACDATELVNTAAGGTNDTVATADNTGGASGDAFHIVSAARFTDTAPVVGPMSYRTEGAMGAVMMWDVPETNECYIRTYVQGMTNYFPDICALAWATTPGSAANETSCARLRLVLNTENPDGTGDQNVRLCAMNPVTPPANLMSLAHLGIDWSGVSPIPWTRFEAHIVLGTAGHIELRQFTDPNSATPSDVQTFDGPVGVDTPNDSSWGYSDPAEAPPYVFNRVIFLSLWSADNENGTLAGVGYSTSDWLGPA